MSPPFENFTFSSRVWTPFLNTESGSLLRREKNKERERERVLSRLLAVPRSIAHQFYSFGKRVRRCLVPSRRGTPKRDRTTSREREREKDAYTHIISHHGDKSPAQSTTQPINLIFRFLQTKSRVQIWLYEHAANGDVLEGQIVGFDEYMNLVLDDCEEVKHASGAKQRDERRQSFVERRFGHHDG